MKYLPTFLCAWISLITLSAHDIITTNLTFTRDISRVFIRRCQTCHGPASDIPLVTYEQARPWAVAIKQQVLSRKMPPWGAVKGFGHLSPDNSLTQEEITIIAAWVVGGAPQGDPALLPTAAPQLPPQMPATKDALTVVNTVKLNKPLMLAAIHPLTDSPIASSRITATFPDGRIVPLVWLSNYQPQWNNSFRFREPINLPKGTSVQSDSPLKFTLQTSLTTTKVATVFTTPSR